MRRIILLAATLALVGAACGSEQDPTLGDAPINTPPPEAEENALVAEDQTSDGTEIVVAEATIVGSAGWVVVHADDGGSPGAVLGKVGIPEGSSLQVVVPLDEPVQGGDYWPMLHVDAGEAGVYEFPGPDGPAKAGEGNVAMVKIRLTVEG